MERYEMAELLSKKANVSLEEARSALDENDWDILDAMVSLERKRSAAVGPVTVDAGAAGAGYSEPQPVKSAPKRETVFTNGFAMIWHYFKRIVQLSVETSFNIIRKDKIILGVPVLVLVVLLICCFWVVLPALVIGLFLGCRYQFSGKRGADAANRVMDKVGDVVDSIKDSLDNNDEN